MQKTFSLELFFLYRSHRPCFVGAFLNFRFLCLEERGFFVFQNLRHIGMAFNFFLLCLRGRGVLGDLLHIK